MSGSANHKEELIVVSIKSDIDVHFAQSECLGLAKYIDFSATDLSKISTVVRELSTNILKYAVKGKMLFSIIEANGTPGLLIEAIDKGPAIEDIEKALTDRYSTSGTLGLGLPGVKRLSTTLEVISEPGKGTHIKATYLLRK
jgi:serine/threonine-protein kinase RsbT